MFVEISLDRGVSFEPLVVFGERFDNMQTAIKYVRSTYDAIGINYVELRLVKPDIVSTWDNY